MNVDLVNDDEHTKFGLILSISSQEKTNSDINQGPQLCCKFAKNKVYNTNVDLVNDNMYTTFAICLFVLKILSKNQILTSIKGRNSCKFAKNKDLYYQRRSCQ